MSSLFPPIEQEAPPEEAAAPVMANREAERAVLGALLLNNAVFDTVGDVLQAEDFSYEADQAIYKAMAGMIAACKPCEPITLHEQMRGAVELAYLAELSQNAVGSPSAARRYAEIVASRAQSRRLAAVAGEVTTLAADHLAPIAERVEKVSSLLDRLVRDQADDDWVDSDQGMVEFLDQVQARHDNDRGQYLATKLKALDEKMDGGLRPGQLIIIGARPSMGKTALAVTIGMNIAEHAHSVAMFSLEMPRSELQDRQVSMVSGIHLSKVRRPERMSDHEWARMSDAVEQIRRYPFHVSDKSGLNINQLRARVRTLRRRKGLSLLIVDYLGLMDGTDPRQNRTTQLEEVTRSLKQLAKDLGIPVILLAQLNREVEKRIDQMPVMSDLRDCGAIEQDADVILFVNRPIQFNPNLGPAYKHYARVRIAKQRGGSTGDIDLCYVGENVRFYDWEGDRPSSSSGARRAADDL